MTPEEHRILIETRELTEENAVILKSIQRSNRFSLVFRVLYWVIIIGSSVGAYYLIQPYVETLKQAYSSLGVF
ncbi:MAG: hypothetical protein AAB484_02315 [Patescibacteria group bacterium]